MGINTHYYTIFGTKRDWDDKISEFNENVYDDAYDDDDTPTVIIDGMGGEYAIFGEILFDSGDLRWGDIKDVYVEFDLSDLSNLYSIEADYKKRFVAKFPEYADLVDKPFKLMTMVYYS